MVPASEHKIRGKEEQYGNKKHGNRGGQKKPKGYIRFKS
jgi:hypothetical protein